MLPLPSTLPLLMETLMKKTTKGPFITTPLARDHEELGEGDSSFLWPVQPKEPLEQLTDFQLACRMNEELHDTGFPRDLEDQMLRIEEAKNYDLERAVLLPYPLSRYFPLSDVKCNCGCHKTIVIRELYNRLVVARVKAGIPFNILSWTRCEANNHASDGSPTSSHLKGRAVDISCTIASSSDRFTILSSLIAAGFKRIGVYPWGFHVDVDHAKASEVLWTSYK